MVVSMLAREWKSCLSRKSKWFLPLTLTLLLALGCPPVQADDRPVDVALLLAVDVSGSVSDDNWHLQRDGIADAIGSPEFGHSISSGQIGRIAVLVLQWGSDAKVVIDWRVLTGRADARVLAAEIRELARTESGATCMGNMLVKAAAALAGWSDQATRRVIDVSGDGADNCNIELAPTRAAVLAQGITVNGLPIVTVTEPQIAEYYETKVIGGPGAFTVVAEGFESFARAMRFKLVIETAEARP